MKKSLIFKSLLLAAFCLLLHTASAMQTLLLAWDATTTNLIGGYVVYYGSESGIYNGRVDVGTNTVFALTNVVDCSTNYFVITAYDQYGNESEPSNEFVYVAPGNIFIVPPAVAGQPFAVLFAVCLGKSYQVQMSSDMVNWSILCITGISGYTGWVRFVDETSPSYSQRFYRLQFMN